MITSDKRLFKKITTAKTKLVNVFYDKMFATEFSTWIGFITLKTKTMNSIRPIVILPLNSGLWQMAGDVV